MLRRYYTNEDVVLTVDAVIRVGDDSLILIERSEEPYMDKMVLPGGHVNIMDESLVIAVQRVVVEELSTYIPASDFTFLTILDDVYRDPRVGRRISIVFTTQISHEVAQSVITKEGARDYRIFQFDEINEIMIGFDHYLAIKKMWDSIKNPSRCTCGATK